MNKPDIDGLEDINVFLWNAALFGVKGYNGNPFMKHATMQLEEIHFDRWLCIFNETIALHFEGPVAKDAQKKSAAYYVSTF